MTGKYTVTWRVAFFEHQLKQDNLQFSSMDDYKILSSSSGEEELHLFSAQHKVQTTKKYLNSSSSIIEEQRISRKGNTHCLQVKEILADSGRGIVLPWQTPLAFQWILLLLKQPAIIVTTVNLGQMHVTKVPFIMAHKAMTLPSMPILLRMKVRNHLRQVKANHLALLKVKTLKSPKRWSYNRNLKPHNHKKRNCYIKVARYRKSCPLL